MAIARVFECKGWTSGQYDELIARGFGGRSGSGVLFHWATGTDDGMRAIDVYESREAADALARDQIGPLAQQLGLPMPEITEYDVHNYLTP